MTKAERAQLETEGRDDAVLSVSRESDDHVLTANYTDEALRFMGWQRAYGERRVYRMAFMEAFVTAWKARYARLTKKA